MKKITLILVAAVSCTTLLTHARGSIEGVTSGGNDDSQGLQQGESKLHEWFSYQRGYGPL